MVVVVVHVMRKLLPVFVLVFACFVLFSPIQKVSALSNVTKISNSSTDVVFPQIVADNNGYLHVTWMDVVPNTIWAGYANPGIFYSRWNGDTWSTPLKISDNTGFAEIPGIAVDSSNTVHVVWDDETYAGDSLSSVVYKTRSATGTWSAIETLARPTGTLVAFFSKIAVNSSGEPNVFYTANTDGYKDSIYWTKKVSGSWSTPELVSKNASDQNIIDSQWADVRQDTAGNIHLIYWSFSQGVFYRKLSAGVWSTPFQVSTSGNIESIRLGVTPGGEVFVAWYQIFDTSINVRWTVSGVWQTATVLTNLGQRSFVGLPIMGVTTDSKERAHVGWGEKDAVDGLIDLKYRSFVSGVWGPARDVDLDNNDADSPFVYPDKWDNQHFSWAEKNPTNGRWELMYRVAEGTIQTIGASGGTITANPGGTTYAKLTIPSGALSSNTEIGLQIGPVPENVDPTQVTIPRAFTYRPHGLTFASPATTDIFYTDAEIGAADERQFKAWLWDSQTATWSAQATKNFAAQNKIQVDLTHFSLYGISTPIVKTTFIKPQAETRDANVDYEFAMVYADGSQILPIQTPEELRVTIKDSNGNTIDSHNFTDRGVQKNSNGNYEGSLILKGRKDSSYTIEVYLVGNRVGSQTFSWR